MSGNNYNQNMQQTTDYNNQNLNQSYNTNIGYNNNSYVNDSNVVFEGADLSTPQEKVKFYISTINRKAVTFIVSAILACLLLVLLILFIISKKNAAYNANIDIPKIIYLGESSIISVKANGKNNMENATTTFTSENEDIIYVVEKKLKGEKVTSTLVPIKEGKTKVTVKSVLDKRKLSTKTQEITVCPAFDMSLLSYDHISIRNGSTQSLRINFGEGVCSEKIVYESSDVNVMTVDQSGTIKGISVGTANIIIKKDNKTLEIPVTITSESIAMTDFNIEPSVLQLDEGDRIKLSIKTTPNNSTISDLNFSGYDSNIINIESGGIIKALKSGATTLKVSPGFSYTKEVPVFVGKDDTINASVSTDLLLSIKSKSISEGTSSKIYLLFVPNNVNDKKVTWKSSNENILVVKNGVIYGKNPGTATVTATTTNNISKSIEINVKKVSDTIISTSDKVESNNWHTTAYSLRFFNENKDAVFYYGETESNIDTEIAEIIVTKDEQKTYYIKSCVNDHCSNTTNYVSKVDIIKPKVLTVAGISKEKTSVNNVKIALKDEGSKLEKWCVTNQDNEATCKWNKIDAKENPVVDYAITSNGIYYVFAKDVAGNLSNSYKFEINNIG